MSGVWCGFTFISVSSFSRYFLALQLKEDMLNQKLYCSEETHALLSSYVVQGEFGDFEPSEHEPGYLDDFPYLEDKSSDFKHKVTELHQRNQ